MSDWISDELPDKDGALVVFKVRGKVMLGRYYTSVPFPFEDSYPHGAAYATEEVTHWIQLDE